MSGLLRGSRLWELTTREAGLVASTGAAEALLGVANRGVDWAEGCGCACETAAIRDAKSVELTVFVDEVGGAAYWICVCGC